MKRENITGTSAYFIAQPGTWYLVGIREVANPAGMSIVVNAGSNPLERIIENAYINGKLHTVNKVTLANPAEVAYGVWGGTAGVGYFEAFGAPTDQAALDYVTSLIAPTSAPAPSPAPAMTQEQFWREMLAEMRKQTELMQTSPQRIAQASAEAGAEKLEWTRKQAFMSECIIAAYAKDWDIDDVMTLADNLYRAGISKIEQLDAE